MHCSQKLNTKNVKPVRIMTFEFKAAIFVVNFWHHKHETHCIWYIWYITLLSDRKGWYFDLTFLVSSRTDNFIVHPIFRKFILQAKRKSTSDTRSRNTSRDTGNMNSLYTFIFWSFLILGVNFNFFSSKSSYLLSLFC